MLTLAASAAVTLPFRLLSSLDKPILIILLSAALISPVTFTVLLPAACSLTFTLTEPAPEAFTLPVMLPPASCMLPSDAVNASFLPVSILTRPLTLIVEPAPLTARAFLLLSRPLLLIIIWPPFSASSALSLAVISSLSTSFILIVIASALTASAPEFRLMLLLLSCSCKSLPAPMDVSAVVITLLSFLKS